jgi:ribosomal protein S8
MTKQKATLLHKSRVIVSPQAFAEFVIWKLPHAASTKAHAYKYRLAYVVNNKCVVRYDNELSKGDHRHYGSSELTYQFHSLEQLIIDFYLDVERWNHENSDP